jgi:hypothetical protein
MHTCIHTYKHTYIYMPTINTCISAYLHTYVHEGITH